MERFPLDLVVEPTSRMSKSHSDSYDNVILFTVLGDRQRGMENSEMHIFQCIGTPVSAAIILMKNVWCRDWFLSNLVYDLY